MPHIRADDETYGGGLTDDTPRHRAEAALPHPRAEQLSISKPEVGEKKVLIVVQENNS